MLFSRGVNCDRTAGRIEMPLSKKRHLGISKIYIEDRKFFRGPKWSYFVNFRFTGRSGPLLRPGPWGFSLTSLMDDPALVTALWWLELFLVTEKCKRWRRSLTTSWKSYDRRLVQRSSSTSSWRRTSSCIKALRLDQRADSLWIKLSFNAILLRYRQLTERRGILGIRSSEDRAAADNYALADLGEPQLAMAHLLSYKRMLSQVQLQIRFNCSIWGHRGSGVTRVGVTRGAANDGVTPFFPKKLATVL